MKKKEFYHNTLQALYHYLVFFLLVAFLVTCTMSLFVSTLSKDLGLVLNEDGLNRAAKLTFFNVILLSVLVTLCDVVRRKWTTEHVAKRIISATRELVQGNFSVRIAPIGSWMIDEHDNEMIDCFNKIAQELGSLETLRMDFVANVSHEMKTPLAVLQNYALLLQTPNLTEEKRLEYAKGVADGSRRMTEMMTNILNLNRLENQQIYPQSEEFDLSEQLCQCLLQYENTWERLEIELQTEIADAVWIRADSDLLWLVWNNLFSNAFKFTPAGGKVFVGLYAEENQVRVCVHDSGCGMTAEVGSHIFEKFYQGDPSHSTQGNGLGLALVKRVVDILQGEISVESTVGQGTTFTVRIRRQ